MTRATHGTLSAMEEGRAWGTVLVHEWMWATDGLGLGHGADLFVYAALFAATDAGTLTYRAPCAELAASIGYARETVQRSLAHLCALDLVWSPDARTSSGGTPRTYAISPGPLVRARGEQCHNASEVSAVPNGISSSAAHGTHSLTTLTTLNTINTLNAARTNNLPVVNAMPSIVENSAIAGIASPTSTSSVSVGRDAAAQLATARDGASPSAGPSCDATSRNACDAPPGPLDRHTLQKPVPPAKMQVCAGVPISSFLSSSDTPDMSGEPLLGKTGARPLAPAEFAAFETLVGSSLLPVDDAFLDRNLEAFTEIVAAGVPADAIVEAYDDYAAYQRSRYRQSGTWRPMHLLHWLQANPNGNIDFVMRRRESESRCTSGKSRGGTRTTAGTTCAQKASASRRGPRLTLCRDRGRALWFVDDDHGSRRIEGAEGIEDLGEATRVYERMYAKECREMPKAA